MMEGVRFLYDSTMDGLKMEELNKGIINIWDLHNVNYKILVW